MFTTKIKSILIAGTIAMGAFAASSGTASAEVRGGLYLSGPGISIGIGHRGDRWGHRDRWDRWDRGDRWERPHRRTCRPRKALRKAKRRGLRRAHIVRANRRGVVIMGRKWGERVVIGFGRHRSCPVRFVRSR